QGSRERDGRLKKSLPSRGVAAESFKGSLLFEPWEVKTLEGQAFKVFTPFWRACRNLASPDRPLPAPKQLPRPAQWPASDALAAWQLTPRAPDWAGGLRAAWVPGEAGAVDRLSAFLDDMLARYDKQRDQPAAEGTSRLSPHLAFGEISARQVWQAVTTRGLSNA